METMSLSLETPVTIAIVVKIAQSMELTMNPPLPQPHYHYSDGEEKNGAGAGILLGALLGCIAWAAIYHCIFYGFIRQEQHALAVDRDQLVSTEE